MILRERPSLVGRVGRKTEEEYMRKGHVLARAARPRRVRSAAALLGRPLDARAAVI